MGEKPLFQSYECTNTFYEKCPFLSSINCYCSKFQTELIEESGTDSWTGSDTTWFVRCDECKSTYK